VRIRFDLQALKHSQGRGHALRFAVGGAVTAATGLVAKAAGPRIGGLLLAFPAILPIGIALIARLQAREVGPGRGDRARRAAVLETTGASAAAMGLLAFALIAWSRFDRWPSWLTLAAATIAWAVVAFVAWAVRIRARRQY
jgi:uncharacterized membrane protein (GlpM family)